VREADTKVWKLSWVTCSSTLDGRTMPGTHCCPCCYLAGQHFALAKQSGCFAEGFDTVAHSSKIYLQVPGCKANVVKEGHYFVRRKVCRKHCTADEICVGDNVVRCAHRPHDSEILYLFLSLSG
jgi:hypothetical protein